MPSLYQLTATFASSPAFLDRPTLDGLLYFALACEHFGGPPPQKLHLSAAELLPLGGLPLVRDAAGWFRCSWLLWDEARHAEFTSSWKKRWASQYDHLADFGKARAKVDTQRGAYKSYDVPLACHALEKAWFYLETDNPARVLELLRAWVPGIGKKVNTGHGLVREWQMEEVDGPASAVYERPLPAGYGGELPGRPRRPAWAGWRPPYWLPDNQGLCSIPA